MKSKRLQVMDGFLKKLRAEFDRKEQQNQLYEGDSVSVELTFNFEELEIIEEITDELFKYDWYDIDTNTHKVIVTKVL